MTFKQPLVLFSSFAVPSQNRSVISNSFTLSLANYAELGRKNLGEKHEFAKDFTS
jgi:hypothetical protein